jgi:hypothetical protein
MRFEGERMLMTTTTSEERRMLAALGALAMPGAHLTPPLGSGRAIVAAGGRHALAVAESTRQELRSRGFLDEEGSATVEGLAWYRRTADRRLGFRAQHGAFVRSRVRAPDGTEKRVTIDLTESPLAWLYRRCDRNGRQYLDSAQFAAGETLRADATRAQLVARTTVDWDAPIGGGRRAAGAASLTDAALAARERVDRALRAVGPELSGVLLDVCCFLKGIETVERERGWPPRTARVVLGLALTRLAAHYGLSADARGPGRPRSVGWRDRDAKPGVIVGKRRAADQAVDEAHE